MFAKPLTPALRSLACLPLLFAATACFRPSINLTAPASPCMKLLLSSGLLEETQGAPLSLIDGSAGGIGAHDVAQGGQLVKANIDKATAKRIGTSCDAEWAAALKAVQPRKRILGLF